MSQENVEIARRWCEAMSAGPEETLSAIGRFADPDVDFYPVRKFPEAEPCHGQEEFTRFLRRFWDSYSESEWAIENAFEVGEDRVLVKATLRAEGRGSGMSLGGEVYICFWFRHGRFFRIENHVTPRGALHALGFEEDTLEAAGLSSRR